MQNGLQPKASADDTPRTFWQHILQWFRGIIAAVKGWFKS